MFHYLPLSWCISTVRLACLCFTFRRAYTRLYMHTYVYIIHICVQIVHQRNEGEGGDNALSPARTQQLYPLLLSSGLLGCLGSITLMKVEIELSFQLVKCGKWADPEALYSSFQTVVSWAVSLEQNNELTDVFSQCAHLKWGYIYVRKKWRNRLNWKVHYNISIRLGTNYQTFYN